MTKKCGTGFQKAAQNPEQSNQADVTISIMFKAWQGSADAHLTRCGTGFQKAAQNPEQSNQADVYLFLENKMDTFKARQGSADAALASTKRHKDANLHLTKKCGTGFQKAAQNPEQSNRRMSRYLTCLRLGRALLMRSGTGFQKAAQNPEQSNQADVYLFLENKMDTFKARQGSADAHLTRCGTGFQKAAQNPEQSNQADVYLFLENKMDTFKARQGSADAALASTKRHKDANLHLTKKCGTGFQRAAQNPQQSNHPDVTVSLFFQEVDITEPS